MWKNIYDLFNINNMGAKNKMISLRLPDILINEYKKFCYENSLNVSNRIRKYMEKDLENWKSKKLEILKKQQQNSDNQNT
jgi:hypothetical protein